MGEFAFSGSDFTVRRGVSSGGRTRLAEQSRRTTVSAFLNIRPMLRHFLGFVMIGMVLLVPRALQAQEPPQPLSDFPALDLKRDWPWWRGAFRNGFAAPTTKVPAEFGERENVLWKARVPGRGHSSPIVLDTQVILATASEPEQLQAVLSFDLKTGKLLWRTDLNQGGFPAQNHPKNTEASTTLATDGELLFVTFFHHQQVELIALQTDGAIVWRVPVGPFNPRRYEYGYAPSPVLYRSSVIIATEQDGESALTALDRKSGKQLWRTPRPRNISFSSPVVAAVAGRSQLLISGAGKVSSYDPDTGRSLWSVDGTTAATCGTMVWDNELVFASGGYPDSETIAIHADGSGRIAWRNNQKCYEQSMIVVDSYVYALTDKGVMYCWQASDGKEMWRERLAGPVSASPIFAGGLIYWSNETGSHYVFEPNPERLLVRENRLGNDNFASPAAVGNRLLLRIGQRDDNARQEFLYCIGSQ
jgi:outer membrane protein assembly factor BamB